MSLLKLFYGLCTGRYFFFFNNSILFLAICIILPILGQPRMLQASSGEPRSSIHIPARFDEDDEDITNDTLYVKEFVLALDVVEREPVEIVESYSMSNARAWCFARIHNSSEMQDIFFEWYYEDDLYFKMNSKIGISANWRTYSSVGLQPGFWQVRITNNNNEVLDEIEFRVSE